MDKNSVRRSHRSPGSHALVLHDRRRPGRFREASSLVALLGAAALVAGCAAKPAKPVAARLSLVASADVNPDSSGRPSPVVVRLYELRTDGEFAGADFFALYDHEKEVLAKSLVSREEYVLEPGETRSLELPLGPETHFLGALAAFRDIRSARWRALAGAPDRKLTDLLRKDVVTIRVEKDSLALSVRD